MAAETLESFLEGLAKEIIAAAERDARAQQSQRFTEAGLGVCTIGLVTPQGIVRVDCAGFPVPPPAMRS